jgi:hypothetical protein
MSRTTVEYMWVEFDIEYDYQPAEKEVRYYSDGSGYPGCPESLEITDIRIGGVDVNELCNAHGITEKLEEKMYENRG